MLFLCYVAGNMYISTYQIASYDVCSQKQNDVAVRCPSSTAKERISYIVICQPLAMDRFYIHDVASADASGETLRKLLLLLQRNFY